MQEIHIIQCTSCNQVLLREPHFLIEANYWNSSTFVYCGREIWIAGSWQLNQAFVNTPLSCPKQSANGWTWTNLDWRSSWHNQKWRRGKSSETLFTARRRRRISADRLIKFIKNKWDVSVGEVSTRFGKGVKMGNVSSSSPSTSNSDDVIWNQTLSRLKLEDIHNVISPLDVAVLHCMHTKTNQLPAGA